MHYVQFGYGLALLALAIVLRQLPRAVHEGLPWKTLSWFAVFQAIDCCLGLTASWAVNSTLVNVARESFWIGSFLFAIEFVRQSMVAQSRWAPRGWVLGLPVFALLLAQIWYPPALGPSVTIFLSAFGPTAAFALIWLQDSAPKLEPR